jgi:hypothetical protein
MLFLNMVYLTVAPPEVDQSCFSLFLEPVMSKLGFAGVYQQKSPTRDDGCAIFVQVNFMIRGTLNG